ncbi:MAG: hypothetical protein PHE77_00625 [Candidatus Pacebacteria bacterium]|nr:hypothetical protein [Candidatus Paceibacterota bacterium]
MGRFSDYRNLPEPQQIGFIVSYVFKLVFFISLGAALTALLASGVLYLVSLSKPRLIILAKQMAGNAMLGIFILLCAYLVLYAINPQLLSLTLKAPKPENVAIDVTSNPYDQEAIMAEKVPFKAILTGAVANLEEKVYKDDQGRYIEKMQNRFCYTDGYGGATDEKGNYLRDIKDDSNPDKKNGCKMPTNFVVSQSTPYIYRAEIPLRETADALKKVVPLVEEIQKLLENCQCGESFGYSDWSLTNPRCVAGLNHKEKYNQNQVPGIFGGNQTPVWIKQNVGLCSTQADDCGTKKDKDGYPMCDLKDVRKNTATGLYEVCQKNNNRACDDKDSCWRPIKENDISFNSAPTNCIVPKGEPAPKFKVGNLIKFRIIKIQEEQAKLQAKSRIDARFLDSASLIAKALDANRIDFTTSQATGMWAYDFSQQLEEWQSAGYKVAIQEYKGAAFEGAPITPAPIVESQSKNKLFARLKALFVPLSSLASKLATNFAFAQSNSIYQYVGEDAATFFFITRDPIGVQPTQVTEKNRAIARDAQRFNLFSLLTDLSLEDIEGVFRDCLASAFGSANYVLSQDQIAKVIASAKNSGAAQNLMAVITQKLDELARAALDGTREAITDDANTRFIKKFLGKCGVQAGCKTDDETAQKVAANMANGDCSGLTNTCCYCVKNLMSNSVPPNFLSKAIANLFTKGLDDYLPDIKNILNTTVKDTLFPPDKTIGDFLNTPALEIYDAILNKTLTRNFDEQIPALNDLLNKQMKDILPDFIRGQIESVNGWFENTVSSSKAYIKQVSNNLAQNLTDKYVAQPMHEWAQTQLDSMGIGIEHLTMSECFSQKFEQGYIYQVTPTEISEYNNLPTDKRADYEPGKCVQMTPDEINNLSSNKYIPKSFFWNENLKIDISKGSGPVKGIDYFDGAKNISAGGVANICREANYSWEAKSFHGTIEKDGSILPDIKVQGDYACFDSDNLAQDIQAARDTISNKQKMGTWVAGGLVNYAEKLAVAFTETALQAALAYSRVFVEDHFMSPLLYYWNRISGFQQGMEKFLTTSVKDILPSQLSSFLQSNIADELDNFCNNYKAAKTDDGKDVEITLEYDLPTGITWDGNPDVVIKTIKVPQSTGDAICKIDIALKTTPWQELQIMCQKAVKNEAETRLCDGVNILAGTVSKALSQVCVEINGEPRCLETASWFEKPLLSLFFPHSDVAAMTALVQGTPKDLICGDLPVLSGGNKASALCKSAYTNTFGFIPTISKTLSQQQKDIMPWCTFINYACKNPLTVQIGNNPTIGSFIKATVNASCNLLNTQLEGDGKCFCQYNCPDGRILGDNTKENFCRICNSLAKNSIFYTLLFEAAKNETDPNVKAKFYVDMLDYFPALSNDVAAAAKNTGITQQQITDQKAKGGLGLSTALALLAGGMGQPTIKDLLSQDEILNSTPYGVIEKFVCPNVIESFERKNPDYTFDSVRAYNFDKISTSIPYTVDTTETFTLADQIKIIANSKAGGADEYILCKVLNNTLQEIAGLDVPLKYFIRPKEFIIMFDMLANELHEGSEEDCRDNERFVSEAGQGFCCDAANPDLCYKVGEKPAFLNQLLNYMELKNPVSALRDLQRTMPDNIPPFAFYVNNDANNCLQAGNAINSCQAPIPAVFSANNIISTAISPPAKQLELIFDATKVYPFGSVLGIEGKGTPSEKIITYYLYKGLGSSLVLAFKEPNQAKVDFGATLDFMQTPISTIIKNGLGNKTIANLICGNGSWCDVGVGSALDPSYYNKLVEILGSTPVDLAETYLTKNLSLPELFGIDNNQTSLMNALANNTALNQPLVDTIGAITGWDAPLFKAAEQATDMANWANQGALKAVQKIQDGLETVLVDWPKQAAQAIAQFFGFEVGQKTADEITRPCYDVKPEATSNADCKHPESEVFRITTDGKKQCCSVNGQACQPRCREVDNKTTQCNVANGETPKPEKYPISEDNNNIHTFCCFAGVDEKGATTTDVTKMVQCKKCRVVAQDQITEYKCREKDESGNPYEIKEGNACCYKEKFSLTSNVVLPGTVAEAIEKMGVCCSTVAQCITNRFSDHLDTMAERMADGDIPLRSLKTK